VAAVIKSGRFVGQCGTTYFDRVPPEAERRFVADLERPLTMASLAKATLSAASAMTKLVQLVLSYDPQVRPS
jgi:hypothetical protein